MPGRKPDERQQGLCSAGVLAYWGNMADTKTTKELTAEVEDLKAQVKALWDLLRERMDGDGRVTRALAKVDEG